MSGRKPIVPGKAEAFSPRIAICAIMVVILLFVPSHTTECPFYWGDLAVELLASYELPFMLCD